MRRMIHEQEPVGSCSLVVAYATTRGQSKAIFAARMCQGGGDVH